MLNDRSNIVVLVDEAHRTQEGGLGRRMRRALPNAFLFGLTGTPINRADRNTFFAFGADEDESGYLSRYGFEESVRDGATMPLHFEPRLPELHVDRERIDAAFAELTGGLSDLDRDRLSKTAARTSVLLKTPARIERICADVAAHFQEKVAPYGFGAQVVACDREACVLYKRTLDRVLPPETSDVVVTVNSGERPPSGAARRRLVGAGPPVGGRLARAGPGPVRGRLPLAEPGPRIGAARRRRRAAAVARPRPPHHRADPAPRPRRRGPRRPRDAGARRRPARRRARRARPDRKSKEVEIKVAGRLRRHVRDPRFRALGERLEALRRKHEQGLLVSVDFLKSLLDLARDVVEAERTVPPAAPEERGKAALTELFEEARNARTPILVERVVADVDEIVRHVRFEGWQSTHAGEREVKQALRKTMFKYKLHQDGELFDRAYGYVRQYY